MQLAYELLLPIKQLALKITMILNGINRIINLLSVTFSSFSYFSGLNCPNFIKLALILKDINHNYELLQYPITLKTQDIIYLNAANGRTF